MKRGYVRGGLQAGQLRLELLSWIYSGIYTVLYCSVFLVCGVVSIVTSMEAAFGFIAFNTF